MEIERKWLLAGFPDEEGLPCMEDCILEQSYLSTHPVVRIRKCTGGTNHPPYRLCIKGEGTLAREEIETDISADFYARTLALIAKRPVKKHFKAYRLPGGETLEVSLVDEGEPTAFFYAEVEFPTVAAAHAFVPPAFLGEEKTETGDFSMRAYWLKTRGE